MTTSEKQRIELGEETMAPIELRFNDLELEAELTAELRVIVRERDVAEVAYSLSEAFAALLPQGLK